MIIAGPCTSCYRRPGYLLLRYCMAWFLQLQYAAFMVRFLQMWSFNYRKMHRSISLCGLYFLAATTYLDVYVYECSISCWYLFLKKIKLSLWDEPQEFAAGDNRW